MAKMSHYGPRKGMNIYLTPEEKALIGTDRVDATLHFKSEREFVRLHPNPHGRYGLTPQKNTRFPFRIQMAGSEDIPPFAVEPVEAQAVAGGVVACSRPSMLHRPYNRGPVVSRADRLAKIVSKKGAPPVKASSLTLREAIAAINNVWADLGGDLEISVDATNHKVTARHMVEY